MKNKTKNENMKKIIEKRICQSCKLQSVKTMVEYAGKMTGLHLCELCQPWVTTSRNAPKEVNGIQIEDAELFIRMLKEAEGIIEPHTDTDWRNLFHKILPNKSKHLSKIDKDWKIRHDSRYWRRLYYFDILQEIRDYRESISSMEEEYRILSNGDWHYARQINWRHHKPYVEGTHNIITLSLMRSSRSIKGISNEVLAELIFESIVSNSMLKSQLEIFSRIQENMKDFLIEFYPTIPSSLQLLEEIISGKLGKKLQYKMLAMNYRWATNIGQSRDFFFRDEDVWSRAFQFLREIIDGLGSNATIEEEGILVKGISGNWYTIRPCRWGKPWSVGIVGRSLACIDMLREHTNLPIGDQLASVVLSLRNDLDVLQHITTLVPYISKENRPTPLEADGIGDLFR
jgi:hypothetical protein